MIIAGEASGDLHGGALVQELTKLNPDIELFGVGGDRMRKAGVHLYYHVNDLAYVGFTEVAKHYFFFRRVFYHLLEILKEKQPDLVVLIDYPGFNLRFAKKAKSLGAKTFYYIAPQVWAWGQGRAKKMAGFIDKMAVIFDFEVPFFKQHGIDAEFVGHPLLDALEAYQPNPAFYDHYQLRPDAPILALFPGSRGQEIKSLLPVMLETALAIRAKHPQVQIAVSKAPTAHVNIDDTIAETGIPLVEETHDLMNHASAAIVASGTATLETALFQTPFVITYKVSPVSYQIGKRLVKLDYIGLANVVKGKKVVPEFIQHEAVPEKIIPVLEGLLFDDSQRERMRSDLKRIKQKLGSPGAPARTAVQILKALDE